MRYDYVNQAWTRDGVYVDCNHPAAGMLMGPDSIMPGEAFLGCDCYGRAHAGEPVPAEILAGQDEYEDDEIDHPHPGEILDWWLLRQD